MQYRKQHPFFFPYFISNSSTTAYHMVWWNIDIMQEALKSSFLLQYYNSDISYFNSNSSSNVIRYVETPKLLWLFNR